MEHRNRTFLDIIQFMTMQVNLPISFWEDVLLIVTYILNCVSSKSVLSTPYELWTDNKPNLKYLRPWGTMAYVYTTFHPNGKLSPRGKVHIHPLFESFERVFVHWWAQRWNRDWESWDANFIKEKFPSKGEVSRDSNLYELDENTPSCPIEQKKFEPIPPANSESCTPVDDVVQPSQESYTLCRSNRHTIPHCHFKIVTLRLKGKCA